MNEQLNAINSSNQNLKASYNEFKWQLKLAGSVRVDYAKSKLGSASKQTLAYIVAGKEKLKATAELYISKLENFGLKSANSIKDSIAEIRDKANQVIADQYLKQEEKEQHRNEERTMKEEANKTEQMEKERIKARKKDFIAALKEQRRMQIQSKMAGMKDNIKSGITTAKSKIITGSKQLLNSYQEKKSDIKDKINSLLKEEIESLKLESQSLRAENLRYKQENERLKQELLGYIQTNEPALEGGMTR